MTFTDLRDQPPYEPAGHDGVVNRLLVGKRLGTDDISIWHGALDPGGGSDVHVHEGSAQVYIGLTGRCTVKVEDDEHDLNTMAAVVIAAGLPHSIRNEGTAEATLLVVSSPALR